MTIEFDPYKHAERVLSEIPQQSARRLTFAERCAAFAAFKIGYRAPHRQGIRHHSADTHHISAVVIYSTSMNGIRTSPSNSKPLVTRPSSAAITLQTWPTGSIA